MKVATSYCREEIITKINKKLANEFNTYNIMSQSLPIRPESEIDRAFFAAQTHEKDRAFQSRSAAWWSSPPGNEDESISDHTRRICQCGFELQYSVFDILSAPLTP